MRHLVWFTFALLLVQAAYADDPPLDPRSQDGSANHPADLGAAGTPLLRVAPADYPGDRSGDLITTLRPNPREISNSLCASVSETPNRRGLSGLVWQWGQFLDHDIDLTETHSENGSAPISVPAGDPLGPNAIPFDRSDFDFATGTPGIPREQINAITAFIDASQVYGSDPVTADSLRSLSGGRLLTGAANLLPLDSEGSFLAGDVRANEQAGLTAMHTVFMREHNRLADRIATFDPQASDEAIYQLARKIVGAEIQAVTYQEFLPALLGPYAPRPSDYEYDENVDPSIANEFSTALFRFGHSMVSADLPLVDSAGESAGAIALRDAFFDPAILGSDPARVDQLLRGLAMQRAEEVDPILTEDLRSFLFGPPGTGGMDLAALNIQRGRDHGLPDYTHLREAYGLDAVSSFAEITNLPARQAALAALYGTVDTLDPWVGALAEDHLPGASLGPLATAALVDQFVRLRDGDRYFYWGDPDLDDPLVESLINWETFSLRDVVVANTEPGFMPANVFTAPEPSAAAAWFAAAIALGFRRSGRG